MHTIIVSVGGETENLSLSYKTMQRYSAEVLEIVNEQIREDWVPLFIANIHWDGKLMETLDGQNKVDRLPILISGKGGIKLLGVPAVPCKCTEKHYTLKMTMLADKIEAELPKSAVFSSKQRQLVRRFVPWWFIAPLAATAPYHDLL